MYAYTGHTYTMDASVAEASLRWQSFTQLQILLKERLPFTVEI